ncbi:MAG: YCF48-related protein [Candidatus Angelobacter sp.]
MRAFAAFTIILLISSFGGAQMRQNSRTDVPLRGISAVSEKVAWASGTRGTVLRTIDGGVTWETLTIAGADSLDFRDIQAFDQNTAFVLSIGNGDLSRIYKTSDGGKIWQRQFTNSDPKAFYDCFAFWDSTHGIAVSDSVDGKFPLIATSDGMTWWPRGGKENAGSAAQ